MANKHKRVPNDNKNKNPFRAVYNRCHWCGEDLHKDFHRPALCGKCFSVSGDPERYINAAEYSMEDEDWEKWWARG